MSLSPRTPMGDTLAALLGALLAACGDKGTAMVVTAVVTRGQPC